MFSRRKKRKTRVEPRFEDRGGRKSAADFSVTAADRAAPPPARKRKPSSKKPGAKAASGARRKPAARGSSGGRRRTSGRGRGFVRGFVYWSFIACIWGGVALAGIIAWYGAQLPSASAWAVPDRPPNVKIVAVDGTLVTNRGATGGAAVGLHEMSPYIPKAVIAIEDRRYFSHFGVDPIGLARAMARNVMAGGLVQGGSTLTQQLAKNLFLTPERTVGRKVQEVLLALWLEHEYSKEQILELYLNRVYFGSGSYGVEAAARRYFGKSARDVSLPEAALLAGLLKAPSRLSPNRNPERAESRAQVVLSVMREQGLVSDTEMTAALASPAARANRYWSGAHHYVADAVMEELPQLIGEVRQDVIVDTTVDLYLQTAGETAIRAAIAEHGAERDVSQGALVAIDPAGAVRAMVGGVDYAASQFDRASQAKRQPGSAFKPFVYLAALEAGALPSSVRNDTPVRFGNWAPENYRGKYHGPVTLETALSRSLNSVAAQLIMESGAGTVVRTAQKMGIASPLKANASLSLGTSEVTLYELTSAYVPFASGGYRADPHLIRRVTTMEGEVLYERKDSRSRVLAPDLAGMMNQMMSQTVRAGTARAAQFDHPAAGKTGTTQNARDAWFVGYTAHLVTGVWFGNDDGKPMKNVTGGTLPAEAWRDFMVAAHQGVTIADLPGYMPFNVIPKPRPEGFPFGPGGRPSAPVDGGTPVASDRSPPSGAVARDRVALPPPDRTITSSTGAPRPQTDVGVSQGEAGTVLDVILGQ
ncbi:transglycosylase domain-containing protein [Oceaniradius stylonematis]|jgi:penicillin-binding protein 1A|uniref:transglycosylase domain-containing protein n=1 Tax=Oceaniradius stylonematis TaxID=2184161 RepID=UPI00273EB0F4|nr:transglycosylase domain-containing protein [Oceaniradius stylonematis]